MHTSLQRCRQKSPQNPNLAIRVCRISLLTVIITWKYLIEQEEATADDGSNSGGEHWDSGHALYHAAGAGRLWPRRLPEIGRQIGKLMYEFRKASNEFKYQMEEEMRKSEDAERRTKLDAENRALYPKLEFPQQALMLQPTPALQLQIRSTRLPQIRSIQIPPILQLKNQLA